MPLGINAPTGRFNGSLYPTFELNPAVRRTARAGATPRVGLQHREARFRPRWLRPVSFTLIGSGSDAREISQFSTRSGVLRAARGQAAGPRDSTSRKNKAHSPPQGCHIRPVAHPPERLRRWATGPAVRRTAKARPIELPHSTMFVLGHTLIKTVRRQRRRNEAQPSLRKCKYFSGSKPAGA